MSGDDVIKYIVDHIKPKNQHKLAIAVLASGDGSNLQALLDFSKKPACAFTICSVITNNPTSKARERAERCGIANYLVDHRAFSSKADFEAKLVLCLKENHAQLIVLAGFLRVLSAHFLRQFDGAVINLHPSLLPKHKGLNAIEKAIGAQDRETGCTVHLVDEGLDTGPIIAQRACPIYEHDTFAMVKERIHQCEHALLPAVVNQIARMATQKP